jgi:hypothetical protein
MKFGSENKDYYSGSGIFLKQAQLYVWFLYPLFFIVVAAFIGFKVMGLYEQGDSGSAPSREEVLFADPDSEKAREELLRRHAAFSGDLLEWSHDAASKEIQFSGWIMGEEDYRAFEARKVGDAVSVHFMNENRHFSGNIFQGEIVPFPGVENPLLDSKASSLMRLLSTFGNAAGSQLKREAIESGDLQKDYWRGHSAIALTYFCDEDQIETTLKFEEPEMILRERQDHYANGLSVVYTYNEYMEVGAIRLPAEISLRSGPRRDFQVRLSRLQTIPLQDDHPLLTSVLD